MEDLLWFSIKTTELSFLSLPMFLYSITASLWFVSKKLFFLMQAFPHFDTARDGVVIDQD